MHKGYTILKSCKTDCIILKNVKENYIFLHVFMIYWHILFYLVRGNQYRLENIWPNQIEAKYEVDKAIIQELNPKLSITLSGYEKLTDQLGKDKTLKFFNEEINDTN